MMYFLTILLTSSSVASSLRDKASQEIQTLYKRTPSTPSSPGRDVTQDPGDSKPFLKLTPPRESYTPSPLEHWVSLKLQSFQPSGSVALGSQSVLHLDSIDRAVMPSIEIGFQTPLEPNSNVPFKWGGSVEAGYSSHKNPISLHAGLATSEAILNCALLQGGLIVSWLPKQIPRFEFSAGPQIGVINYSQSSSFSQVQFSRQVSIHLLSLSALYHLRARTRILLQFSQLGLNSSEIEGLSIPAQSAQLGMRFLW